MQQIGEAIKEFKQNKPIPHKRAYWVIETANLLQRPFKQVLGLTRDWPENWIEQIYLEAKSFEKNPPALWWKLYKQTKE